MKTLMILSFKNKLEFIQVINEEEKSKFAKKYRASRISAHFFDVPEDEQAALALGLYQAKEELIQV